ncbi:hypothetical protein ACFLUV_03660 [Elusimicrobiota bacterium]
MGETNSFEAGFGKKILIFRKLLILAVFSIPIIICGLFISKNIFRSIALAAAILLFVPFFIYQYIMIIQHCMYLYIGNCRKRWLIFLILEPLGLFRFFYFVKHIRRYIKQSGRYAYSRQLYYRNIGDLKIALFFPDPNEKKGYKRIISSITESPVYEYLESGDKDIFIKYHTAGIRKGLKKKHPNPCSVHRFDRIYRSIKENGYSYKEPNIKVREDSIISDGMHRACILYKLYGPEFKTGVILKKKEYDL